MKRKIIATMAAIICCISLSAQDSLKITFLNPEPIVIGGKEYRKGDFFPASKVVKMTDKQVIQVFDATIGKPRTFSKELLEKSGHKSIWAYLTDSKRLSTRNSFNRTFGLFERLSLKGELPIDSYHYYYVSYEYRGEQINKRLPVDSTYIVIDRSIFTIDGTAQKPFDVKLKLFYRDDNTKNSLLLLDKLVLNISKTDACCEFISAYLQSSGLDREVIRELITEYLTISDSDIDFQESDIELFINKLME